MLKDTYLRASERRLRKGFPWLGLCLVISLGLNTYLLSRMVRQSREMSRMDGLLKTEIKGLRLASSSAFDAFQVDQQRFYEMKNALETAAITTPHPAQPDGVASQQEAEQSHSLPARTTRSSQPLAASQPEAKHHSDGSLQEIGTPIRSMVPPAQDTSASPEGVNAKPIMPAAKLAVADTVTKVEQVSIPFESRVSNSKRTDGAEMGSAVANKLAAPPAVKEENERNYFDLDLVKDKTGQTFGDLRIALKKSDLKHNRYTLTIFADDKVVEKKDQAVDEPVQVYVAASAEPYEIVIKQVKRDEVIGSLAVPKPKTPPKASANAASL
jgi:hypothetical protein